MGNPFVQILTLDQALIVSGYTGFLCCNFADLHADIERRAGNPVLTHDLVDEWWKDLYRDDFIAICHGQSKSTEDRS